MPSFSVQYVVGVRAIKKKKKKEKVKNGNRTSESLDDGLSRDTQQSRVIIGNKASLLDLYILMHMSTWLG